MIIPLYLFHSNTVLSHADSLGSDTEKEIFKIPEHYLYKILSQPRKTRSCLETIYRIYEHERFKLHSATQAKHHAFVPLSYFSLYIAMNFASKTLPFKHCLLCSPSQSRKSIYSCTKPFARLSDSGKQVSPGTNKSTWQT